MNIESIMRANTKRMMTELRKGIICRGNKEVEQMLAQMEDSIGAFRDLLNSQAGKKMPPDEVGIKIADLKMMLNKIEKQNQTTKLFEKIIK
jgi:hypothetical protein